MNNGMFVEMCAYVANRDLKNGQSQREYSDNESEQILIRVEPSLMTKSGRWIASLWHFTKALYKRPFTYAPKKGAEEVQSN